MRTYGGWHEQQYILEAVMMSGLEVWGWNLVKIYIGHELIGMNYDT